jgi:hypothetical protein
MRHTYMANVKVVRYTPLLPNRTLLNFYRSEVLILVSAVKGLRTCATLLELRFLKTKKC